MRHVPWDDIFTLSASAGASEFCEWVQVAIDAYINHRNHNPRNQFFHLHQKDKYSESKVKFRKASNRCKRVLEAAKLAYANKTKESITSQKLGSCDFWWIANSVLNKDKSAIPPLFNGPEMLSSASDKQNCLLKTFLGTLILMTQYLFTCFPFYNESDPA